MPDLTLLRYALTAALAGLLFGFDTVVISGAEQALEALWQRGEVFHGAVVIGSALWGTVVGALTGGWPTDRFGRKATLVGIGVLYTASALGSALATDPFTFAALRFVGGLGVGASTIAAPAYISEIAPAADRGKLTALYQLNIVLGILLAYVSNYLLSGFAGEAWRYMIGVEALPAVVYTLLALTLPLSPRWLAAQGREEEARAVMRGLPRGDQLAAEWARGTDRPEAAFRRSLLDARLRRPVLLAVAIAAFNQLSGINAFLYYAPRVFEAAGLGARTALLNSVGIGVVNLVFTFLGLALIDRLGRRTLMYAGSVGYVVSLSLVAAAFWLGWSPLAVPAFLFVFIAAHALGQGTVIWVFIAEIFPQAQRASGQALGSSVHWVLAAAIPSAVPALFRAVGTAPVFATFALLMVGQLIWVWRAMPETRGVPLERLTAELSGR